MGTVGDPRFRGVNFVKVRGARGLTAHHRSYVEAQLAMHHDPSRRGKNARRMDHDHLPHRAWDASPTRERDTRFLLVMEQICCRPGAGKFLPRLMREQPRIHPARLLPALPVPETRWVVGVRGRAPGVGLQNSGIQHRVRSTFMQLTGWCFHRDIVVEVWDSVMWLFVCGVEEARPGLCAVGRFRRGGLPHELCNLHSTEWISSI